MKRLLLIAALPYLWLLVFFAVPFLLVALGLAFAQHGGDEEYIASHERFRGLVLFQRTQAAAQSGYRMVFAANTVTGNAGRGIAVTGLGVGTGALSGGRSMSSSSGGATPGAVSEIGPLEGAP